MMKKTVNAMVMDGSEGCSMIVVDWEVATEEEQEEGNDRETMHLAGESFLD